MEKRLYIVGLSPEESRSGEWELWLVDKESKMGGILYKTSDKNVFDRVTDVMTENIDQIMDIAADAYTERPMYGTATAYKKGELQKITHKDYGGVKL